MSKDILPAVVTNDENSGVYLVVIPDREGSEKSAPTIVLPGQSSDLQHRSIDALAAYSIKTGQPVKLQLLDMVGDRGESASLWKYPDGSHATVKVLNGETVLDMRLSEGEYYVPMKGRPSPSAPDVWGVNANELQQIVNEQLKNDADKNQSLFGPGGHLRDFLKENFSANAAAVIYASVQEEVKRHETKTDCTNQADQGLSIG